LAQIALSDADRKAIVPILTNFKIQYESLVRAYNQEATAAWSRGEKPDAVSFLVQRDQIVQSTRDALNAKLSPDGTARFDAHVKAEKKRMKVNGNEKENGR
jgi:hypothetical protein